MRSRYLLALCIVAVVAVTVCSSAEELQSSISSKLLKASVKLLGKEFAGAAYTCLEEAAKSCKSDWKNPEKLIKCAGQYAKTDKGRCLIA